LQANKLKLAIRTKCQGLLSKKVLLLLLLLLHDIASQHTAKFAIETINHLGFEVLEHLACSPDLAPSYILLFGQLRDPLQGHRFSLEEEL
jgi:hypothetical protein